MFDYISECIKSCSFESVKGMVALFFPSFFSFYISQVEVERSLYSDHELRALDEAQRLAKKKADLYDEEHDQGITLAQDLEDMWEQAFLQFKPGARETGL